MRLIALAGVLAVASPVYADLLAPAPPPPPTPFDRGKFGLSLGAGREGVTIDGSESSYIFVAGGVGYYVLDGVEVGFAAEHFFGDGPGISIVTPSLRYVAQPLVGKFPLIPYVGMFYDHEFVSGYPDVDGVGARAGVILISGHLLLGLGVAVERTVSTCTVDCTIVYPDVSLGVSL